MTVKLRRALLGIERPRQRLFTAITIGALAYLLTAGFYLELRLLLTYDIAVATYLALLLARLLRTDANCSAIFPAGDEPSGIWMLVGAISVSATGLVAVSILVENDHSWPRLFHTARLVLSLAAIFLSWLLLNTGFANHYARVYFEEIESSTGVASRRGLQIPAKDIGDYWDFLYYSFTIAMCYQTSDIAVTDRKIRQLTLLHALVSFFYVAVIFGLVVNVISNIV